MTCMLITQFLDQETSRWHGPIRVLRVLIPVLTFLGGQLLFHARFHYPLVARPDQAMGDRCARQMIHVPGTTPPPILLIHAENDPFIALHHAHRLVAAAHAAGRSIQEYYTSCGIHCGSYGHDPQRYMALFEQFVAL